MTKSSIWIFAIVFFVTIQMFSQTPITKDDSKPKPFNPECDGCLIKPESNLDSNIGTLSSQIFSGLTENQKKIVAIADFVDGKGNVTDFSRFLSVRLMTKLLETKKLKVIGTQAINKLLKEQKLTVIDIDDGATAKIIGEKLKIETIIFGTITDLGKSLSINVRLISTDTGEGFAAASATTLKDADVCNLMNCESKKLDDFAQVKPIEIKPIEIKPTLPNNTEKRPERIKEEKIEEKKIKVSTAGYEFEMRDCSKSGGNLKCDIFITNNNETARILYFDSLPEIYDNNGNKYVIPKFNENGNNPWAKNFTWNERLPVGIKIKASFSFSKILSDANKITNFSMNLRDNESGRFSISLSDIPIK